MEIPIFNSVVWFYRGNLQDFHDLISKEGFEISTEQDNADGLSFDFDGDQLIWIETNAPRSVVVHECLHAVLNICDSRGIGRDNDEVLCYMLEYLIKSL